MNLKFTNGLILLLTLLFSCQAIAQDDCLNIPDVNIQNNNSYLMAMGSGSRIELHGADAAKRSYTKLASTATAGATQITVLDMTGWEVGDQIAIAPTDFDWAERETRTITAISGNGRTITLNNALSFRHNGTTEEYSSGANSWELDMRAEVALLSRNVKIQGNANSGTSQFGGHTMTMMGAEQHISGVEYFRMGQANILGRYPIHWHLIRDGGQGQYVKNSSVHGGFNKGITIHDTHMTYVEDNVVYNNIGHGFFFEDATETGNVLRGNIAFGQREAPSLNEATIPSDFTRPASYWVTNPNNHFIDNVAAGAQGTGIWMTAEPRATGAALATGDYDDYVPKMQPVGKIDGFVSHSNRQRNFNMGWRIREEGNGSEQTQQFIQRFNEDGANYDFKVENMTLYKGAGDGQLWIRAFGGHFDNIILADAFEQIMFRGDNALSNSLILADTETNEPTNDNRKGIQIYDEGVTFNNLHFVDYNTSTDDAFYQREGIRIGTTFSARGLTFQNGNLSHRHSDRTRNGQGIDRDNHTGSAILDIDGSLFGTPMSVITPPLDETGKSVRINVPGWNAHPDAEMVSNEAWVNPPGTVFGVSLITTLEDITLTRSDGPSVTGVDNDLRRTMVIADEDIVYTVAPGSGYEEEFNVEALYINRGGEVIYRFLDMPSSVTVEGAQRVDSRAAMEDSALSSCWLSNSNNLFVKLVGVDPIQAPSQAPAELTNIWSNMVTIHPNGGAQSSDQNYTGAHNKRAVDPGEVQVPAFVSGDSRTRNITSSMARWSEASTWEGSVPNASSVVVIGAGKTVVLDRSVTVHGIIISGGELLIEDGANLEIELTSDFILVNNGGLFQAGTEANPIETEFTLTLAGTNPNFDLQVSDNTISAGQGNVAYAFCNNSSSDFMPSFIPDPNKRYYIDLPEHNLRLAANGSSETPFAVSTNNTGANVVWHFIERGDGLWNIQRADGGALPRLRSNNTEFADMESTSSTGEWTRFMFTEGASSNTHFITLPEGPSDFSRLQMEPNGDIRFTSTSSNGSWVSWRITEIQEIQETQSFIPDPNKEYYIDLPEHNLRLAANGNSETPFAVSTNNTGANVVWRFIERGDGLWNIQRADGGALPRLRSNNTEFADMESTSSTGEWTRFMFTEGASSNTHFITLLNGPADFSRLQMEPNGDIRFTSTSSNGSWVSWRITEIPAEIRLYQHCGFSGTQDILEVGNYPNFNGLNMSNNSLSSLRVPAGLQVTLYANTNYNGASISFTADDNCLINNNFNDRVSSLRIEHIGASDRSSSQALVLSPEFGQKTRVDWVFRQDVDKEIKQFTILHGTSEGLPLEEIGVVSASDATGVATYQFLHQDAQEGKNHYQINVEYEDGSTVYAMWDDISFEIKPERLHIAPNPAADYLKVDVSSYMDKKMDYFITNIQGTRVTQGTIDIDHNEIIELDLASLQNGMYIIHLQPENHRAVAAKFVVAKDY